MIWPLIQGLQTTLKHFLSRPITMRYPEQKWTPYPRFRGLHHLERTEEGAERCVACFLCATICPAECITVEAAEGENHEKYAKLYHIDLSRCIFCGFCVESCPVNAITMTGNYELSEYSREELLYEKERLLAGEGEG